MIIAIQRARAIGLILILAAVLLIMGALTPVLPKANATVSATQVLLFSIQSPFIPCHLLDDNPQLGGPALITQVHRLLKQNWDSWNPNSGVHVTYEEALAVTGLSILSSCPQYYGYAPTVDGVPYGSWVMIPTTTFDQSLFMAYWKGNQACSIASGSGVEAGVQFLMQSDYRIPYAITKNDAKAGMLLSAASRCSWEIGAVREFLGG